MIASGSAKRATSAISRAGRVGVGQRDRDRNVGARLTDPGPREPIRVPRTREGGFGVGWAVCGRGGGELRCKAKELTGDLGGFGKIKERGAYGLSSVQG